MINKYISNIYILHLTKLKLLKGINIIESWFIIVVLLWKCSNIYKWKINNVCIIYI